MTQQTLSTPRTSTLFRQLFKAADIKDYIAKNEESLKLPAFHEYITQLCSNRGEKKNDIAKRSSIERTYASQLFNGTRKPSRDKAIQLAIGFGLNLDETQNLLKIAGKSQLYPRLKRDAAIVYCIDHQINIAKAQMLLYDLGLHILGDE